MSKIITEYPQFFTATNLEWKHLLQSDKYKDIIIESMRFLVEDKRVIIYGFVIMINHLHMIWQMLSQHSRQNVQRDFLKFTAQRIKCDLKHHNPEFLSQFLVNAKDRKYQFWERNPLSIDLYTEKTLVQKLNYIPENPVRAGICQNTCTYKYSSALLYRTGVDNWGFLTHYRD